MPGLRARRVVAGVVVVGLPIVLTVGFGHRGVHAARNLMMPGTGLIDERPALGVAFVVLAGLSVMAWMRWGADWIVVAVVVASMATSAVLSSTSGHAAPPGAPAVQAHEFPLVLLVVGVLSRLAVGAGRLPGLRRLATARSTRRNSLVDAGGLGAVNQCRVAAIASLAGDADTARQIAGSDAITVRARRVNLVARARRGVNPFAFDHAYAYAARRMAGVEPVLPEPPCGRLGVPCSEPTWVRPLDATLYAIALDPSRCDLTALFAHEFALRRGHRAAWYWTPLGVSAGRMSPWEHAVTTALARSRGWVDDGDWAALRKPALGAAARGVGVASDERLIAAARLWLAFVDDEPAARIIMRPTICHDPLAVAIDRLAHSNQLNRTEAIP